MLASDRWKQLRRGLAPDMFKVLSLVLIHLFNIVRLLDGFVQDLLVLLMHLKTVFDLFLVYARVCLQNPLHQPHVLRIDSLCLPFLVLYTQ